MSFIKTNADEIKKKKNQQQENFQKKFIIFYDIGESENFSNKTQQTLKFLFHKRHNQQSER